jgi:molecular chaperone DnaK (HSP70)
MTDETLSIAGPDGQIQPLVKKGAQLPASGRAVFATQRAGERSMAFRLLEGEGPQARLVASYSAELPAGLPGNTWLAVHVTVGADRAVSVEIRENLRRLRIEPEQDAEAATARVYRAG